MSSRIVSSKKASLLYPEYKYQTLAEWTSRAERHRYRSRMSRKFTGLTRNWDEFKNAEWVARHYSCGKLILATTVQLTSLNFATSKHLPIVIPYLYYYSLLTS